MEQTGQKVIARLMFAPLLTPRRANAAPIEGVGDALAAPPLSEMQIEDVAHRRFFGCIAGHQQYSFIFLLSIMAFAAAANLAVGINDGERMRIEFLLAAVAQIGDDMARVILGSQIQPPAAKWRMSAGNVSAVLQR